MGWLRFDRLEGTVDYKPWEAEWGILSLGSYISLRALAGNRVVIEVWVGLKKATRYCEVPKVQQYLEAIDTFKPMGPRRGRLMRAETMKAKPVDRTCGHRGKSEPTKRWGGSQGNKDHSFLFFSFSDFLLMPLIGLTHLETRGFWTVQS